MQTESDKIRRAIRENEVIASHIPDRLDVRVQRLRSSLRGTNMCTPYFACYVEDEDGDIAEITFDVDMRPLLDTPIYGVTYRRKTNDDEFGLTGASNDKDGLVHSIDELVAKLFPSLSDEVDDEEQASMDRHPASGSTS